MAAEYLIQLPSNDTFLSKNLNKAILVINFESGGFEPFQMC